MVMAQACSDFKTFFNTSLAVEEAIHLTILDKLEPAPKNKKVYSDNSSTLFGNTHFTNLPSTSINITQTEPVNQIVTNPDHNLEFSPNSRHLFPLCSEKLVATSHLTDGSSDQF